MVFGTRYVPLPSTLNFLAPLTVNKPPHRTFCSLPGDPRDLRSQSSGPRCTPQWVTLLTWPFVTTTAPFRLSPSRAPQYYLRFMLRQDLTGPTFHRDAIRSGLKWYYVQLGLNLLWSPIFFNAKSVSSGGQRSDSSIHHTNVTFGVSAFGCVGRRCGIDRIDLVHDCKYRETTSVIPQTSTRKTETPSRCYGWCHHPLSHSLLCLVGFRGLHQR